MLVQDALQPRGSLWVEGFYASIEGLAGFAHDRCRR